MIKLTQMPDRAISSISQNAILTAKEMSDDMLARKLLLWSSQQMKESKNMEASRDKY